MCETLYYVALTISQQQATCILHSIFSILISLYNILATMHWFYHVFLIASCKIQLHHSTDALLGFAFLADAVCLRTAMMLYVVINERSTTAVDL